MAGVFLEPALPNIKDWSNIRVMLLMDNNPSAKGVITLRRNGASGGAVTDSDPRYGNDYIKIDLSAGNQIYKDDCDTVQPPAFTVCYIMKIR